MSSGHSRDSHERERLPEGAVPEPMDDHLASLHAFVRLKMGRLLAAKEGSMDLVQSACREVLADLPRSPGLSKAHVRHWLFMAAERKIVDRARYLQAAKRDARLEATPAPGDAEAASLADLYATMATPSQHAAGRELLERMEVAFAQLPEDDREVILLSRLAGLSHAEIAERRGATEGAVRTQLYRALGKLGATLGT